MWISGKKYKNLLERIESLERAAFVRRYHRGGRRMNCTQFDASEIIDLILKRMKLKPVKYWPKMFLPDEAVELKKDTEK